MSARPLIALLCLPAQVLDPLVDYMQRHGYDVAAAGEPWQAESVLSERRPDVAVVGPEAGTDEWGDMLRRHATEDGPAFIMLSASSGVLDRVLALELGAADVTPVDVPPRELAARIGGVLARRGRPWRELLLLENATIDLRSALVMYRSGEEEMLSPGQVAMLRLFMANPGTVLSRDEIIAAAPAEAAEAFDRSIDSRIVRLRRKLDTDSIVTVRGAGYRFDPPRTASQT